MGIDIMAISKPLPRRAVDKMLQSVATWASEGGVEELAAGRIVGTGEPGQSLLNLQLFPEVQDMELVINDGRLVAMARTNGGGPGYHQEVCDVLKRMAPALKFEWEPHAPLEEDAEFDEDAKLCVDETGYWVTGDRTELEEHMLSWLGNLAAAVLQDNRTDLAGLSLCMPINFAYPTPTDASTAMGPRSIEWLRTVKQDPRRGIDFWPWWDHGRTASYYHNRAAIEMWCLAPWRPPLDEEEDNLLHRIHENLARARELDPSIDVPSREWAEIIANAEIEDVPQPLLDALKSDARTKSGPLIGYRRGIAHHTVSLFSFQLDGSFAVSTSTEEGEPMWSAGDHHDRALLLNVFSIQPDRAKAGPKRLIEEMLKKADLPEILKPTPAGDGWKGACVGQTREDGDPFFMLRGFVAVADQVGFLSLTWVDPVDRAWAMIVWETVSASKPAE